MRETFTELYVHLVWATWDRLPLISPDIQARLYAAILAECEGLQCTLMTVGGMADHVHLLVKMPAFVSISQLVKQVKGSTSHLMTHEIRSGEFFKWQGSFGAFSVGKDEVQRVRQYIEQQQEHHQHKAHEEWQI